MKNNNTWNIRRLVDESFVPSTQQASVFFWRFSHFWARNRLVYPFLADKLAHQVKHKTLSNLGFKPEFSIQFEGQLNSKCPFGVFKSSNKPTKCFPGFLPQPLKKVKSKKYSKRVKIKFSNQWYKVPLFFGLTSFQRLGQKSWKTFRWFFGRFEDKRTF